jgi:hypothetical protein
MLYIDLICFFNSAGSSSGQGDTYVLPKQHKIFKCSIGRTEKGEDAALLTLGSVGIPLAIAGAVLGSTLSGGQLTTIIQSIVDAITELLGGGNRRRGPGGIEDAAQKSRVRQLTRLMPLLLHGMIPSWLSSRFSSDKRRTRPSPTSVSAKQQVSLAEIDWNMESRINKFDNLAPLYSNRLKRHSVRGESSYCTL